jgi:predicted butyrate kinase (DUF1464 family)
MLHEKRFFYIGKDKGKIIEDIQRNLLQESGYFITEESVHELNEPVHATLYTIDEVCELVKRGIPLKTFIEITNEEIDELKKREIKCDFLTFYEYVLSIKEKHKENLY